MSGRDNGASQSAGHETRDRVNTYFPIVKWVWGGGITIAIAVGTILYSMKMDNLQMQFSLESAAVQDKAQDKRLDENVAILKDMHAEQVKMTQELKTLNLVLRAMAEDAKKEATAARKRIDAHLKDHASGHAHSRTNSTN
jgi:hypothetical protein